MSDNMRFSSNPNFDVEQLVLEAQHRWLRPTEICEILRNYKKFRIAPEPPTRPPSGSLFLFDRKVLRYFRKDGHNWRKKKDGKTVKEAHERLKAESIDVLHCYYAHGQENENFQRRTYWMLEEIKDKLSEANTIACGDLDTAFDYDLSTEQKSKRLKQWAFMHIVLVHYLEVKGNKASFSRPRDEGISHVSNMDSPACSNSITNDHQLPSHTTDTESLNSTHMSEYDDAESDNNQARSRYHPLFEFQHYEDGPVKNVQPVGQYDAVPSLFNDCDQQRMQTTTPQTEFYTISQGDKTEIFDGTGLGLTFSDSRTQFDLTSWDEVLEHCTPGFQSDFYPTLETEVARELFTDDHGIKQKYAATAEYKHDLQLSNADVGSPATLNVNLKHEFPLEGKITCMSLLKQPSLDFPSIEGEGLKKHDSFSRWMSKELGEVGDSNSKYGFEAYWDSVENETIVENSSMTNTENLESYLLGPSVSQDQLFSIVDFSPNWAYTNFEVKVLITGTFLKNKEDVENCSWSCMFGEVEVPAEVLADNSLRCYAPQHKAGKVPFYITCSNRLACSEVREFEYRDQDVDMETSEGFGSYSHETHLQARLGKLVSLGSVGQMTAASMGDDKLLLSHKISSLLKEADDGWFHMLNRDKGVSHESIQDQLLQKLLKERLHDWLLQKIAEDGKGPNVLDKEGQGVLHLAAAVGYDWAIQPTIAAGVSINFRDIRGWTALHWASSCGREHTVVSLISLGAAPGALTDPTPEFPSGRTPADLASGNGHKGIAGFLAESSLTSHLSTLTLKETGGFDMGEVSREKDIDNIVEESSIPLADADMGASMKDSLSAVRNASLAAARIHQVFRVHSFQRKKRVEYGDDKCGISDERALSLLAVKSSKPGQLDMPVHSAAVRIQNKFRGWKGRKEFLIIRQRIVKIQAHIRGHQVRKRFKNIVWTVGIVEKAILRWRRKGSGLRGFRSEVMVESPAMQAESSKEDDYDFLQEGRKQTEVRLEKALARVKSMVHYPEARDQYRRLVTAMQEKAVNESVEAVDGVMMELEELWEDEPSMPTG